MLELSVFYKNRNNRSYYDIGITPMVWFFRFSICCAVFAFMVIFLRNFGVFLGFPPFVVLHITVFRRIMQYHSYTIFRAVFLQIIVYYTVLINLLFYGKIQYDGIGSLCFFAPRTVRNYSFCTSSTSGIKASPLPFSHLMWTLPASSTN